MSDGPGRHRGGVRGVEAVTRRCRRAGWWRGELGRVRRVPPLCLPGERKQVAGTGPHSAGLAQELAGSGGLHR